MTKDDLREQFRERHPDYTENQIEVLVDLFLDEDEDNSPELPYGAKVLSDELVELFGKLSGPTPPWPPEGKHCQKKWPRSDSAPRGRA